MLSIILSCLGLFGLVSHAAEMRTKEIGIRKVMGANTRSIVSLLSIELLLLVLAGNIIAMPLAAYGVYKWLQEFTFRKQLSWTVFAISLSVTLIVALIVVSWHSIKTAAVNPVKSLRMD